MDSKIEVSKGKILILSLCLFLLLPAPVAFSAGPQGVLNIAWDSLREESFLPWVGTAGQCDWWEIIYEYPFYLNMKTEEFLPGLAMRYEYSPDFTKITVYLRKGVPWQNGWGEVTAEDFKFSYAMVMSGKSSNSKKSEYERAIKTLEVVDPYTLIIHLKQADPLFYENLCIVDNPYVPILCKKYVEKVGEEEASRKPVGSGPYRLVEHKLGAYFKFEALDKHWRMVPEFKTILFQAVPEESTRLALMKTGEIDVAMFSLERVPELEKAKFSIRSSPSSYSAFLNFGGAVIPQDKRYKAEYHNKSPWADVRVREAMNIAIDREAIVKAIYHGLVKPAAIILPVAGWKDIKPLPYDPKRAKRLLAEAGYPNGFSLLMTSNVMSPGEEMPKLVETVASYWMNIGLKPKIEQGTYTGFRPKFAAQETSDMVWVMRTRLGRNLALQMLSFLYPNGSITWYQSTPLKDLLDKLSKEFEEKKRTPIFKQIGEYFRNDFVNVPITFAPTIYGCGPKVGDWPVDPFSSSPNFLSYIRHSKPLNNFRLYELK